MESRPTYAEQAADFTLWAEYVDTSASMTSEEFDAMSEEDRIALIVEAFGPEAA